DPCRAELVDLEQVWGEDDAAIVALALLLIHVNAHGRTLDHTVRHGANPGTCTYWSDHRPASGLRRRENDGVRFSRKAVIPSRASSVVNRRADIFDVHSKASSVLSCGTRASSSFAAARPPGAAARRSSTMTSTSASRRSAGTAAL